MNQRSAIVCGAAILVVVSAAAGRASEAGPKHAITTEPLVVSGRPAAPAGSQQRSITTAALVVSAHPSAPAGSTQRIVTTEKLVVEGAKR